MTPIAADGPSGLQNSAPQSPRARIRPGARWAAMLAGTGVVLGLLYWKLGGVAPVWQALGGASRWMIVAAVALAMLAVAVGVIRWQMVLRAMGFRLPFREGLRATLEVFPLVVVAPSRSNEVLRAASIHDQVPFWAGAGSVLAEKAIDLHTLLWIGAIGAGLQGLRTWCGGLLTIILLAWGGGWLVWSVGPRIFQRQSLKRFEAKASQVAHAFRVILRNPKQLLALTLISMTVRGITIAVVAVLLAGLHASVDLWATVCLAPTALLVGLMPLSLTGIGVRDAAFLVLLHQAGHPVVQTGPVVAATLGYTLISTWLLALLSLPVALRAAVRSARSGQAPNRMVRAVDTADS